MESWEDYDDPENFYTYYRNLKAAYFCPLAILSSNCQTSTVQSQSFWDFVKYMKIGKVEIGKVEKYMKTGKVEILFNETYVD